MTQIMDEIGELGMAYEDEIERKRSDQFSKEMFGRKMSTAINHGYCVSCGPKREVLRHNTRPDRYRLYKKDGLCPECRGLLR